MDARTGAFEHSSKEWCCDGGGATKRENVGGPARITWCFLFPSAVYLGRSSQPSNILLLVVSAGGARAGREIKDDATGLFFSDDGEYRNWLFNGELHISSKTENNEKKKLVILGSGKIV